MRLPDWREEVLSRAHDRRAFDCGVQPLNEYLQRYAWQNEKTGVSKTVVAASTECPGRVLGYYSLAPRSIDFEVVPEALAKRLPRYPIPAYLLARLAVDKSVQGGGLGAQLFLGAGERCLAAASEAGGAFMLVEAKDLQAVRWYERFGATPSDADPLLLILPLAVIDAAVGAVR